MKNAPLQPPRGRGRPLAALLLVAALILIAPVPAEAQEPPEFAPRNAPTPVTTLEDLGFTDVSAVGANVELEFFFSGAGDFRLGENSKIRVDLSHSNLLEPERSAVSVGLNGRPLRAIQLDASNVDFGSYEVAVPRELIEPDFNRLTFNFSMTTGLQCENPQNPALFANVLRTTFLEIDFADRPPVPALQDPNLSDYPYPFFRAGYPVVAPVNIVIPDQPTAVELSGAFRLAADLASKVAFDLELLNIRTVSEMTPAELRDSQALLVGTADRNPLILQVLSQTSVRSDGGTLVRAGQPLDAAHGLLAVAVSPWNRLFRSMVVSGVSEAAVARGIDALTIAEPSALLAGPEAILVEPIIPPAAGSIQTIFTFRDVGIGEQTFTGVGQRLQRVAFSAPAAAGGSFGLLDLVVSLPDVHDRRRSNVVIDLNGQTVATIALNKEETRRVSYQVRIPSDAMRVGPNLLDLKTIIYHPESLVLAPCDSSAPERLWITIHSDSAMSLPPAVGVESRSVANLSALPYPFAGIQGLRDTTFIVDESSPDALRAGMLGAIALGRRSGGVNQFDVMPASIATGALIGDRHVVAVAIPPGSNIAREIERVLPLVLRPDGSRALVEESGTLAEILDTSRVGAIQMTQVPWAPQRSLLSVSGTDTIGLQWASEALATRGFSGNVALLQSARQVNTFSLERVSTANLEEALQDRFTQQESRVRAILAGVLIGLGSVVLLVAWAMRGRIRPRFVSRMAR